MKKLAIILIAMLWLLAGCKAAEKNINEQTLPKEEDELITVGFSQLGSESLWRIANTKSVSDSLTAENGFSLEFNNARQRQDNQIKALRGFISQRVDYIAFSPVTEEGWETVLGEAREAGIPVILVDRKISTNDDSLYTTWIGSDARLEGERAGEWLEENMRRSRYPQRDINIVVLQGTTGSSAQLGRMMGFDSISDRHSNWHILEQAPADFTTAKGKEVMKYFLDKYEKIDVVVSQNDDMTFGAIAALNEAGIKCGGDDGMIIISFDAVRDALKLVSDGIISVDVECNPLQGDYIADVIRKLENGEVVERSYVVDEQVFTKENVDAAMSSRAY